MNMVLRFLMPLNIFLIFIFFILSLPSVYAQLVATYDEIIKLPQGDFLRAKSLSELEDKLRRGDEVVSCVAQGGGAYDALRIIYRDGGVAILKLDHPGTVVPQVSRSGYRDYIHVPSTDYAKTAHEIASYKFASVMDFEEVPPTRGIQLPNNILKRPGVKFSPECQKVLERFSNLRRYKIFGDFPLVGSAQTFIHGATTPHYNKNYVKTPRQKLFDFLIWNCDRPGNKNIVQKDGKDYFIDNGMAFLEYSKLEEIRTSRIYNEQNKKWETFGDFCQYNLDLKNDSAKLCSIVDELPEEYEKIKFLNKTTLWTNLFQRYLSEVEYREFWQRVQQIVKDCAPEKGKAAQSSSDKVGICGSEKGPYGDNNNYENLTEINDVFIKMYLERK